VTAVTYISSPLPLTIPEILYQRGIRVMDRRRQQRVFVELPVKIWGVDANAHPFMQPASVRTISGRGATLQGVSAQLKPGCVVDLQYQETKAQFRVVWLGKVGTEMQGEVGVENVSGDAQLWDIDPLRCAGAVGQG
jgi:hypothetical protein